MSVQTGLTRELDCLKDQLDVMREAWHNLSDASRYEWEEPDVSPGASGRQTHPMAGAGGQHRLPSLRSEACLLRLPSLMRQSEACLAGPESSHSQANLLEHSYTVSHSNLAKVMRTLCYENVLDNLYGIKNLFCSKMLDNFYGIKNLHVMKSFM